MWRRGKSKEISNLEGGARGLVPFLEQNSDCSNRECGAALWCQPEARRREQRSKVGPPFADGRLE
jgi:hypothetical protein